MEKIDVSFKKEKRLVFYLFCIFLFLGTFCGVLESGKFANIIFFWTFVSFFVFVGSGIRYLVLLLINYR